MGMVILWCVMLVRYVVCKVVYGFCIGSLCLCCIVNVYCDIIIDNDVLLFCGRLCFVVEVILFIFVRVGRLIMMVLVVG